LTVTTDVFWREKLSKEAFFSVIIPTYNREQFLKKAIQSVLKQTFKSFELIVIDDGSTDHSKDIVTQFNDDRIIYCYQGNQGVAHARNRGLEMVRGRFIAFLDSDDWWRQEKLERFFDYIERFPDIRIFHSQEKWFKDGKIHNPKKEHDKPTGIVYSKALPLCCISISTAVIKCEVFDEVGIFDKTLTACEDYDFWLRATNQFEVKLIPEYLTLKDGGRPDQLSLSIWGLDRFRIKSLDKMLSSEKLSDENYQLTLNQLRKKCRIFIQGAEKRGKRETVRYYRTILDKYQSFMPICHSSLK